MKKIILLLIILCLVGCITGQTQENEMDLQEMITKLSGCKGFMFIIVYHDNCVVVNYQDVSMNQKFDTIEEFESWVINL